MNSLDEVEVPIEAYHLLGRIEVSSEGIRGLYSGAFATLHRLRQTMNSDTNAPSVAAGVENTAPIRQTTWTAEKGPSAVVAELVADVTGREQTDLEPLHYTIDAEALNTLCDSARTAHLEITFTYEGVDVRITSHGVVEIRR